MISAMNYQDRIVRDPQIVGGEPVLKGTRVTLKTFVLLEKGEFTAIVHAALRLVFRALIEAAKLTKVPVSRIKEEDVDLMVSDAHFLVVPESV